MKNKIERMNKKFTLFDSVWFSFVSRKDEELCWKDFYCANFLHEASGTFWKHNWMKTFEKVTIFTNTIASETHTCIIRNKKIAGILIKENS